MSGPSPMKCERRDVSPPRGVSPGRNERNKAADQRADQIARLATKAEMLSHQVNNMRQSGGSVSPKHPRTPFPRGMRVTAASELTVRGIQAVAVGDLGTVHGPSDDPYLVGGVNVHWDRRRDGGSRRINVLPADIKPVYDPMSPTPMSASRPYSTSPAKPSYASYVSPLGYSPTNTSIDAVQYGSGSKASYQYRPATQIPPPNRSPMHNRPVSPSHPVMPVSPPVPGSPDQMQYRPISQAQRYPSPGGVAAPPSPGQAQDEVPVGRGWHGESSPTEEQRATPEVEEERQRLSQLQDQVERQRSELQKLERLREEAKQAEDVRRREDEAWARDAARRREEEQQRLEKLREEARAVEEQSQRMQVDTDSAAQMRQLREEARQIEAEKERMEALRAEARRLEEERDRIEQSRQQRQREEDEERARLAAVRAELKQLEVEKARFNDLQDEARRVQEETQRLREQRDEAARQRQQEEEENVQRLQRLRTEMEDIEAQRVSSEGVRAEMQRILEEKERIQQLREEARKQRQAEEEEEAERLQRLRDDIRKIEEEKQSERARVDEMREAMRKSREQEEAEEENRLRRLREDLRRVEEEKRAAEAQRDEEARRSAEERVQLEQLRDEARRQREKVQEELDKLEHMRAEVGSMESAKATNDGVIAEVEHEKARLEQLRAEVAQQNEAAQAEQARLDQLREQHRAMEEAWASEEAQESSKLAHIRDEIRKMEIERERIAEAKAELEKQKEHDEVEWALEKQRAKQDEQERLHKTIGEQEAAMKEELAMMAERKRQLDAAVAAEEERLATLARQIEEEEKRAAQQAVPAPNGHPADDHALEEAKERARQELEAYNAKLKAATEAVQEEERRAAQAAALRELEEQKAAAAREAHQREEEEARARAAEAQAEEARLELIQARVRSEEERLTRLSAQLPHNLGEHRSSSIKDPTSVTSEKHVGFTEDQQIDMAFGMPVMEETIIVEQGLNLNNTTKSEDAGPVAFGSASSLGGSTAPAPSLKAHASGVWMSASRPSIRLNKTSSVSRSQLSRAGSIGKILVEQAEEDASNVPMENGEDYDGEIPDDAIWWQVPDVDVDSVSFVHPPHGDPPCGTTAPRPGAIVTFDMVGTPPSIRLNIDAKLQPRVDMITMERNENGVFLLFPGDSKLAAVEDRTVCLPPDRMGEVVAGILSLCKKCNVQQHLNYEYESLANQEVIVERYLNNGGVVPWPFVNKLLSPDYLQEPACSAATAAALCVLVSLSRGQARCMIM